MTVTIDGTTGITTPAIDNQGNLTVDTNTLFVDSANNRVGVGTASPTQNLDVTATGASTAIILAQNTTATSGGAALRASNPQNLFIMGTDDNGGGLSGHANSSYFYTTSASPIVFMPNATERMKIDSIGAVTMPYQPAFLVRPSTSQTNFVVNTTVVLVWGSEVFDQNSDFASNQFTAPVTGKYLLTVNLALREVDSAASYIQSHLITSNRNYEILWNPYGLTQDVQYWYQSFSVFTDMDAGDIAYVSIRQQGGTQQLLHTGDGSFAGYLVC